MQRGQPLVARADVVAPVLFEVPEEPDGPLEGEVAEGETGDRAPLVGRDEAQEEPDRVPVAAHRGWTEPFDRNQVVDEEGVQQGPERRVIAHGAGSAQAGSAKASKRRFASSSRAGVTVR